MKTTVNKSQKRKVAEVDSQYMRDVLGTLKQIPACPVHGFCLAHYQRWIKHHTANDKALLRGVLKKVEARLGKVFFEAYKACEEDIKKIII